MRHLCGALPRRDLCQPSPVMTQRAVPISESTTRCVRSREDARRGTRPLSGHVPERGASSRAWSASRTSTWPGPTAELGPAQLSIVERPPGRVGEREKQRLQDVFARPFATVPWLHDLTPDRNVSCGERPVRRSTNDPRSSIDERVNPRKRLPGSVLRTEAAPSSPRAVEGTPGYVRRGGTPGFVRRVRSSRQARYLKPAAEARRLGVLGTERSDVGARLAGVEGPPSVGVGYATATPAWSPAPGSPGRSSWTPCRRRSRSPGR